MELKKSKSNKWNFFGKLFLTLTLVSMTIAYLIPLIGILFFYPIADLCLMALSAFIVARLPVAVILQPIIFTVIWIFLGLARDIPHVPALLFGNDAVVHSNVKIFRQVDVKVNSAISIEGDVNPVVAALGRSGVIRPRLHSSGMAFESLERANARSAVIDIPDEIWRRGFVPIIGGEAYPKVKIKVLDRLENFDIEIQVLSGQNEVAGIYKRSLSRPPKYPGDGESQIWYWIVNMLSNSLWRNLFDQTTDTNFNKEIANFLGDSLGKKLNTTWHGPFKTLKVTSDKVIEYSGGDSAPMHLYKIKSTLLKEADNAGGERHWEVCNVKPESVNLGTPGYESVIWAIPSKSPPYFNWLQRGWTDFRMLTFYCDTERKKILTVSYFDVNPSNLRVSTFSLAGRLERVSYFEFPNGVPYPNLILPGTLALSESGGISFTSLHEVRSGQSQNETADKDKYRSIEITSSDIP